MNRNHSAYFWMKRGEYTCAYIVLCYYWCLGLGLGLAIGDDTRLICEEW